MNPRKLLFPLFPCFVLTFSNPVSGQVNNATIVGRALDTSGAVIPNAKVTAKHLRTNLVRSALTSPDGSYILPALPIGDYELMAEMQSFKTEIRTGIVLGTGEIARLDFSLGPSAVAESVTVSAPAPLVNTASPELGALIDPKKVVDLPLNGRNFAQLVTLQPGVVAQNWRGSSFVFNGLSNAALNITLDGTDASFIETPTLGEMSSNSLLNAVSLETVAEVRVQTGAFTAEVGRASSGGVNIVTRSGSNSFHGAVLHFIRNDAFDARNFFADTKAPLRQNQYGGHLGGRIVRDRLFFFSSYEGAARRIGRLVTDVVPSVSLRERAPAVFKAALDRVPLPVEPLDANTGIHRRNDRFLDDENLGNVKIDHTTSRLSSFVRYSINKSENSTPSVIPSNRTVFPGTNHQLTLSSTAILSPNTLNEVRLGFNRWILPRTSTAFEQGLGTVSVRTVMNGVSEGRLRWSDNSYTWADTLSLRRGRHNLKSGFEVRRIHANRIQQQNTTYTFNTVNDFLANRIDIVRIIFGTGGIGFRQTQTGIFFQDDFQVHPRLTLNLGLRYEYYTPFKEVAGRVYNVVSDPFGPIRERGAPLYEPDRNNFNPRVGFAWDVTGNQRTSLRGGAGIYTSPLAAFFAMDFPSVDPRVPFYTDLRLVDAPDLVYPLPPRLEDAKRNPLRALELGLIPSVLGRLALDPHVRDTYSMQWNLALQRQLSPNWAAQWTYVGNRQVKNMLNSRTLNLVDPAIRRRPVTTIGQIDYREGSGQRSYQAFQATLRKRESHGLSADLFYTWSHTIVYGGEDAAIQDMNNIAGSRGDAATDLRHVLRWTFSYRLPFAQFTQARLLQRVFGGWSVQTISQAQSGLPINVLIGRDVRGDGTTSQRPNYVGGPQYVEKRTLDQYFNRAAFALPAAGTFGNLGRTTARGWRTVNIDLSLIRRIQLKEGHGLQIRAEAFSLPNNPAFGNPNGSVTAANFGRTLSAGGSRQLQFGLRYEF